MSGATATDAASESASDIAGWLAEGTRTLAAAGVQSPRLDAQLILAHAIGCERLDLVREPEAAIDASAAARAEVLLRERAARRPLAQILGKREFWGLEFQVTEDTLDPRPDSETLIAALSERLADRRVVRRILDLGTGTGCLLLALLHEFPRATGIGVDRSAAACAVARENARRLGLAERAEFLTGDWGNGLQGSFDVIVTNPPYIARAAIAQLQPEVRLYEPRTALDGGADGLDAYRALAPQLARLVAPGGAVAVECGAEQSGDAAAILAAADLHLQAIRADLAGVPRCLVLTAGKGGESPESAAKKPLGMGIERV